jgi:glycine C-acetyltransferase
VEKKIDIYTSSLSKGLGSFGGYIASQKNVIDISINKSKSFIYTSALPSLFIDDAIKRFDSDREKRRKQLWENTNYFSIGLKKIGYENKSKSHIIPIMIGKEKLAIEFAIYLRKNGIFVHPIRYPTVPKNQARIRISITALLTKKQIKFSLDVFDKARKKFRIG